jgi:primary-amine oxidase
MNIRNSVNAFGRFIGVAGKPFFAFRLPSPHYRLHLRSRQRNLRPAPLCNLATWAIQKVFLDLCKRKDDHLTPEKPGPARTTITLRGNSTVANALASLQHYCVCKQFARPLLAFLACLLASVSLSAQTAKHPLDGLSIQEHWAALQILRTAGKVNPDTRFPMMQLKEPPKPEVLAWKPGQPIRREAFVVVKQGPQTFEAVVDLTAKKLLSWTEIKGVQPPFTDEELDELGDFIKNDPQVQAALKRRGITDLTLVQCGGYEEFSVIPNEEGKRLFHGICFQQYGPLEESATVEGLTIVVDANEKKVLRIIEGENVPIATAPFNYDQASVGTLRDVPTPISIQQPMGPAYHLDGQTVSWQKWRFHFRLDRRLGLILNNVAYRDGNKLRSILYEASLSEIFVPYMDPGEQWFDKNFFDASIDGSAFSSSMEVGADCPDHATYFDEAYADWKGAPRLKPRAVCLFEQPSGVAWRHDQDGLLQSRRARELVLRTVGMFGNYDYVFDWIFSQTGAIRVRVGATGGDQTKSVKAHTAAEDPTGEASVYGRFIADGNVAVDHDHFFCFRLDFDIDGTDNSFVRDKFQVKRLPPDSVRKSLWVAVPETAKTEEQAKSHMSMEHPENWRVINPNIKNYLGYPVGYEIMGGENAMPLLSPDDFPQQRAGFTDYQLWVTPYRENERYPAGDYPMQSRGGEGLPAWTKANRPIENTDIVLWYTIGFHHVPNSEDWPIMPVVWHEFELKPVNFFAHNPALDLPN